MNQKEESQLLKQVEETFVEAGAQLIEKDAWGRRGLAYSIGGSNEGVFVIYYYEMDPSKLKEVDEALHIMPGILRHLLVKPPKGYSVVKYSEQYEAWLKERETEVDRREREKEEKLKKQVTDRAKRQVKRVQQEKKEEPAAPVEKEKIAEQLEKLIPDDELDL